MKRAQLVIVLAVIVAAGVIAWLVLGGPARPRTLSGYIEAQDLYLAAPVSGTVASVAAVEGQRLIFEYEDGAGSTWRTTVRTYRPELVRDDPTEAMLFDPGGNGAD